MSITRNESAATSAFLFLSIEGEPMRFFIRPGPTKMQLQSLILNGGGVMCRTQEPNAILLAEPGDITDAVVGARHFYISTKYIHDCVAQNQQLDIESYRFSNLQPVQTRAISRKCKSAGRMGYSLEDDTAILNFIGKHQKEAKGNRIWQRMECQNITNHSWQSMKNRFIKHLQHKLVQKAPVKPKKGGLFKANPSSVDDTSQPTPKKMPKKKAKVVSSFDSDPTQLSCEHEEGTTEQPKLQNPPEEANSPQDPASEKRQTDEIGTEAKNETDCDESEETEVLPKRARTDTANSPAADMPSRSNDQAPSLSKKQNKPTKSAASSRKKLGILKTAAREFEDSETTSGSQEDQPLSQTSTNNGSDADDGQIMAVQERALREQKANPEHPIDSEESAPAAQTYGNAPSPDDEDAGPSSAALPIVSNAHMFLFHQESQEELSQPSEDELSQSLLDTKQHVMRLIQESKKDLVEVMKALLKASGDVSLALSYLRDGYDPEVHMPIWTRHDDDMLFSADSLESGRLCDKYGAEGVSKRAAFLKLGA